MDPGYPAYRPQRMSAPQAARLGQLVYWLFIIGLTLVVSAGQVPEGPGPAELRWVVIAVGALVTVGALTALGYRVVHWVEHGE